MKYIRAILQFIGFLAVVAISGGITFWYIGHKKAKEAAAVETNVEFKDISMTPVPAEQIVTPGQLTLSPPPQVSPQMYKSAPRKAQPVSAPKSKPIAVADVPTAVTVKSVTPVTAPIAKKTAKAKPTAKPKKAAPMYPELPQTSIRSFRVTDNGASPRTGRGIVNVSQTTDLERQVIRDLQLEEIKKATELIRTPPVWESGVVKFLSGNK